MKTTHCSGCKYHHNAGHPATSNKAKQHNDWCCAFSKTASKAIGQCKLTNKKEI